MTRTRIQDLTSAVLAGAEPEELLELLVRSARTDLGAEDALLVLADGAGGWIVELADGPSSSRLLGAPVPAASGLGTALRTGSAEGVESIATVDLGSGMLAVDAAVVDAGEHGTGALLVLGPPTTTGPSRAGTGSRERLDALAALVALTLRLPDLGDAGELDDERGRIARDLHDLAIQELFAVGMELEALAQSLSSTGEPPSNARIRSAVAAGVEGVENAVAQIRQIVQSLRRERSEATLAERLRHEVGLATSGLGFVPTLRMPADPSELDRMLPREIAEDVVAVVRECLANAARHAHASAVAVSVSVIEEGVDRVVQVDVSDNGRGIDPSVRRRSGLANMSSRARRHSGWVDAISLEPGTMISWRVTLPPED